MINYREVFGESYGSIFIAANAMRLSQEEALKGIEEVMKFWKENDSDTPLMLEVINEILTNFKDGVNEDTANSIYACQNLRS